MADQQKLLLKANYKSSKTGDKGFQFQEEILQFLSIRMIQLDLEDFSIGYEVRNIPKFDDVVVEFRNSGRSFTLALQAKLIQNVFTVIRHGHLFEECKTNISGRSDRDLWEKMNLKQYLKEIAKFWMEKKEMKFILFTNASLENELERKMEVVDSDSFYGEIFSEMSKEGAQIQRFGKTFQEDFENISPVENDNFEEFFEFVQENLIMVTNSLNLNHLKDLNVSILKKHLQSENNEFHNIDEAMKVVRESILKHIEIDETSGERKILNASDIKSILENSVLHSDLSHISTEFKNRISMKVEFKNEILNAILQEAENANIFECSNFLEVNAFKVFRAIEKRNKNVFIIRWSKLNEKQKITLRTWNKNKIVIIVNMDESREIPRENFMLVFVKKCERNRETVLSFSVNDLTEESREDFLETKIKFQNVEVDLERCFAVNTENSEELLSEIFSKLFLETILIISDQIPDQKIRNVVYIDRKFKVSECNEEEISEKVLLKNFHFCTVKGDPGIGKSMTLQKMAVDFKRKNPQFWVEFIELGKKSECFYEKNNSDHSEFSDANEAKKFLFENLLNFGNDNLVLSQEFIEFYFTLENPPVVLVFDGFDEIMPHYEGLVVDLIQKLSSLKIRIFVSGRMHCEKVLRELHNFKVVTLPFYTDSDVNEFVLKSLNDFPDQNALIDVFLNILSKVSHLTNETILRIPLFLNLMLKMFVQEYEKNGRILENLTFEDEFSNEVTIYEKLFEQSFNRSHEKTDANVYHAQSMKRIEKEMKESREHHTCIAFKELKIENISIDYNSIDNLILERGFVSRKDGDESAEFYFVHRTFAEYFCAVELEKRLHCEDNRNKAEALRITKGDDSYSEIAKFIEQILNSKLKMVKRQLRQLHSEKTDLPLKVQKLQ